MKFLLKVSKLFKKIEDRAPEILFIIFMGTLGYAIYLLKWGLVQ